MIFWGQIAISAALGLVENILFSLAKIPSSPKTIVRDVEELSVCLQRLEAYLADRDGNKGSAQLRARDKEVGDVANEIQDILEEFMFYVPHRFHRFKISDGYDKVAYTVNLWTPLTSLHELRSKITDVKRKIDNIVTLDQVGLISSSSRMEQGTTSGSKPDHHEVAFVLPNVEEIMGFKELEEAIILQLEDQGSRNMTISVVGPGGSGKTTIVHKVYERKRVQRQFDCRAWVRVSRSVNIEELFCSMLKQFCNSRKEPIPSEGTYTQAKLRNYLKGKNYIVVLDDIWSEEHWESIHNVLPRGFTGSSRIIVTTQNSKVASVCAEPPDCIHALNGLPWPMAWDLFCKKAFHTTNGKCPPELVELSQKIVKRCGGLPFAVVAVGSLLSKKQQFPLEWKKVYDGIGPEIGIHSDLSIIDKILLPAYIDLPSHLKICFLYFCIFPEDYSIERVMLVRLWIAEGFVSKTGGKTPEDVAESYLNELIERNLVCTSTLDFDGRARYCRVLSLIHRLIILKSEELKKFSLVQERDASPSTKIRLLVIDDGCIALSQSRDLKYVRSAFLFKGSNVSILAIEHVLRAFKLVRVLDLRDAPLDKFPEDILLLNLLRYLCLRNTKIKKIPNSIKKLSYLETLDLKQTNVTKLPEGILQLHKLRHLLIYWYNVKNYVTWDSVVGVDIARGIGALANLQKLSLIKSDNHHEIAKALGALTQLRKLGLIDLKEEGGKYLCESVQKMVNLSTLEVSSTSKEESLVLDDMQSPPPHLQRLYLKGHLRKFPRWISKLDNLFRIGLKWSRLRKSPLDVLQELPNLLELEMVDAFTGSELVFKARRFKKLKVLHVEQFEQLDTVVVEEGAMPMLQKLSLCKCVKLEMIPLGIKNLTQVEELLLYDMPFEFTNQLQKSREDREMVCHIPLIHSCSLQADETWSLENLS